MLPQIIAILEDLRERPPLYVGGYDVQAVLHFINGLEAAFATLGLNLPRSPGTAYNAVVVKREWAFSAIKPWEEMKKRGLSDKEVIAELILIDIESWKLQYSSVE